MKCSVHNIEMVKVSFINEFMCSECVPCPQCGKEPSIMTVEFGATSGKNCLEKNEKQRIKDLPKSMASKREYFATPFWRLMGQKPKPHELAQEREMKRRGLTYGKLAEMRSHARGSAEFNASHITKKVERGELRDAKPIGYGK